MAIIDVEKWQKRGKRLLKKIIKRKSLILMYHRIAEPSIDPWGLAVSPNHFAEHLEILKKYTQPMSFRELALAKQAGKCPERAVAITFDDGYADNLYLAKPILDQYEVPATVFIATGYTGKPREFWWDELENICFQPGQLPDKLTLALPSETFEWQLGEAVNCQESELNNHQMRAWEAPPGTRMYLYHEIWQKLQDLTDLEREKALDQIAIWSNYQPTPRLTHRPMTAEELISLESSGWIEIGAHTVNHVALTAHAPSIQKIEIEESKIYLEKLLNHSISTFTYPFGIYDQETVSIVKDLGFVGACSTVESTVWQWSDRFILPRFCVLDWDGAEFEEKILNWLKNE
jgi:peptidoglycan/xylan/chitin deacetylase (PgdA/CDA1 family)